MGNYETIVVYEELEDLHGETREYRCEAEVGFVEGGNGWACTYEVCEPMLTDDETGEVCDTDTLKPGWSDKVSDKLRDAYIAKGRDPRECY